MKLTNTKKKYLLLIDAYEQNYDHVRAVDLAARMGVARSSVHRMLCEMQEAGLVEKMPHRKIRLTEEGRQTVTSYREQYEGVYRFLTEKGGLNKYEAQEGAFALLDTLSPASIEQLCK